MTANGFGMVGCRDVLRPHGIIRNLGKKGRRA